MCEKTVLAFFLVPIGYCQFSGDNYFRPLKIVVAIKVRTCSCAGSFILRKLIRFA